ncbi:hypothetical protein MMC34_004696 [Xylographa carneopallida]|nr:hypothetical protein [Xylographa carneopallida]
MAPMDSTQTSIFGPNLLMPQSGTATHRRVITNTSLHTSNYQLANPENTYIMDEQPGLSDGGNNNTTNLCRIHGTSSSDQYIPQVASDVYVCTNTGCAQQFTSLREIQQHKDEQHQNSITPVAYHSFYVLHSSMSRYGYYKSAARFWCCLCSIEKGFQIDFSLRDHVQKHHPWVSLPEQLLGLPQIVVGCPPPTVLAAPELMPAMPNMPEASRSSSHETTKGNLTCREQPDNGNETPKRKKRVKNGQLDWEAHREVLYEIYMTKDHSLHHVMEHMANAYNFHAKVRAYKERFKLWGFDKNVPARDMSVIVALVEKRKREDDKDSLVFYKGRFIQTMKMQRFKRRKMTQDGTEDTDALPSHIRCETPPIETSISKTRKYDDCSTQLPELHSRSYNVKGLADATFNDYWVLNEPSKVKASREIDRHMLSDKARTLLCEALAQETRDDREAAEHLYRGVLDLPETEKDSFAVFDALRGIVRLLAKAEQLESAIPELERLVAGCFCLFGPDHETYMSLALGLAVKYFIQGRPSEGDVLVRRLLATYQTSALGKVQEDSCAFLLSRTSRWDPEVVGTPSFNAVYWRLIEQYELSMNWDDSITLTLDIVEELQDSSSRGRVLAKTTESYLRRAYGLYAKQEKPSRYAHSYRLLNFTLGQLNVSGGIWMDKVLVLFDVLHNDLTAQFFSATPIAHDQQPITKLIQCYEALSQPLKVTALSAEVLEGIVT